MWPAASCFGGYRTPAGARYPSQKATFRAVGVVPESGRLLSCHETALPPSPLALQPLQAPLQEHGRHVRELGATPELSTATRNEHWNVVDEAPAFLGGCRGLLDPCRSGRRNSLPGCEPGFSRDRKQWWHCPYRSCHERGRRVPRDARPRPAPTRPACLRAATDRVRGALSSRCTSGRAGGAWPWWKPSA